MKLYTSVPIANTAPSTYAVGLTLGEAMGWLPVIIIASVATGAIATHFIEQITYLQKKYKTIADKTQLDEMAKNVLIAVKEVSELTTGAAKNVQSVSAIVNTANGKIQKLEADSIANLQMMKEQTKVLESQSTALQHLEEQMILDKDKDGNLDVLQDANQNDKEQLRKLLGMLQSADRTPEVARALQDVKTALADLKAGQGQTDPRMNEPMGSIPVEPYQPPTTAPTTLAILLEPVA